MRDWVKEMEPTLAYARHLHLKGDALMCWLRGVRGKDVIVEHSPGAFEIIEITTTYNFHDRLTDEMLNEAGWVAPTTAKIRNPTSRLVEYAEEDRMDSPEDILDDWAQRIQTALRGKQRENYGHGSTLLVSCRGLDQDLEMIDRALVDVLDRVSADALENDFSRTIVIGWKKGRFLEL